MKDSSSPGTASHRHCPRGISRYMSAPVKAAVMSTRRGGSSSIEVRLPWVILPRAPDVIAGGWTPQEFNLMFRVLAAVAANRPGRSSRRGTLHFPLPARPQQPPLLSHSREFAP